MQDVECFFRGMTVCDIHPSPDGWEWQAFVAVEEEHPLYKSLFFSPDEGRTITMSHVTHFSLKDYGEKRWWFMVGPGPYTSRDAALLEVLRASDALTAVGSVSL